MAVLNLELPEDLRQKLAERAAESGHGTVEQYVHALLRADAGGELETDAGSADELEVRLERRLASGRTSIEATPEFWSQLNDRARRAGLSR